MAELSTDTGKLRASRIVCLALACSLCARGVAADGGRPDQVPSAELEAGAGAEPAAPSSGAKPGLPRELFWLSASAALVSVSLGGLFGLRAIDTHDRARALPEIDPARFGLRDEVARDERAADYLFTSAALLAATSVVLALLTDWERVDRPEATAEAGARLRLYPAAGRAGAGLSLRGELF